MPVNLAKRRQEITRRYRHLHGCHDVSSAGAKHGESEDAVAFRADPVGGARTADEARQPSGEGR
jgi:hypothetical protein